MMKGPLFNFVLPLESEEKLQEYRSGAVEDFAHLYCQGEYCWALQTYLILRDQADLNIKLSYALDPAAINLAHGNLLRILPKSSHCFCVSLQADFPRFPLAQFHIVQNKNQEHTDSAFLPLWPQVGQIGRAKRGTEVKTVAYQGEWFFTDLDAEQMNVDLQAIGMEFRMLEQSDWMDLSDVDVLLGIRSFNKKLYQRKPPSKLVNAWHAGIPFVGGWDSAFSQVGDPGEDYIRVSSSAEMFQALEQLKADPALYQSLVEAGNRKASAYTLEALALQWTAVLQDRILKTYSTWQSDRMKHIRFCACSSKLVFSRGTRAVAQILYRIPLLKMMRDRYYDPVN